MKGLLMKDLKIIFRVQRFTMLLMLAFLIWFGYMGMASMTMGYMVFLAVFISVNTISYDDFNNGTLFLFTLPFERKEYVAGKYVLGILLGIMGAVISFSAVIIMTVIRNKPVEWAEYLFTILILLAVSILMLAVALPIHLAFGTVHGRYITLLFYAAIGILGANALIRLEEFGIDSEEIALWFQGNKGVPLVILAVAVYLICMAVSYMISLRIVEKKDL
ncbi:MAG: ABC-2 transporter permease [Lachnoclostridium sp.]|nr:ABC-2 transporter permease [Lachnospira sp.]MCM1249207.1 ABC-2 transporter permease [Lachnoclostridium sp.]MCM1535491.1 ABC-2 transporter permease [Clostridium sp.]